MTSIAPQTTTPGLGRIAEAEVDPQFVVRWSRRALSAQPISQAELDALFEAARWAPSANNLQPWLFVFAREQDALSRARALLKDVNQAWAVRAPVLVFVFARRFHPETGAALRTAQFDTGAAWQSRALQAHRLGLSTRPGRHPSRAGVRGAGRPRRGVRVHCRRRHRLPRFPRGSTGGAAREGNADQPEEP